MRKLRRHWNQSCQLRGYLCLVKYVNKASPGVASKAYPNNRWGPMCEARTKLGYYLGWEWAGFGIWYIKTNTRSNWAPQLLHRSLLHLLIRWTSWIQAALHSWTRPRPHNCAADYEKIRFWFQTNCFLGSQTWRSPLGKGSPPAFGKFLKMYWQFSSSL